MSGLAGRPVCGVPAGLGVDGPVLCSQPRPCPAHQPEEFKAEQDKADAEALARATVHIAGPPITINDRFLRQRCVWCGAVIIDEDVTRIQVQCTCGLTQHTSDCPASQPYPTWLVGGLVAVDKMDHGGGASWMVPHAEGEALPSTCCTNVDPSVTL